MSLFSFLRKNKQESASDDSAFYSRAEEDSKAMRGRSRRRTGQNSKDDPVDPVLPEKKRARRRLIGAVALVLAAVIGLPMILDSEPKPLADDIAIQIPSKDKVSTTGQGAPAAAKISTSASLDPKEEMVDPATIASTDAKAPPAAPSSQAVTQSQAEASPIIEHAATDKPKTGGQTAVVTGKTEVKPVERTDDGVRAKALLDGKPEPKTAEQKSGKFVIQVAALATKEKVDELQNKLKSAGIKSHTQKISTQAGERTRIRVGPFNSKEEAEKVNEKILKLGLNSTLVPA